MHFIPDESEDTLLEQCLAGSVGLTNNVFARLPLEMRQQLTTLIFNGAEVMVTVVMSPVPSVIGTVRANGHSLEFFRIESPPENRHETTH